MILKIVDVSEKLSYFYYGYKKRALEAVELRFASGWFGVKDEVSKRRRCGQSHPRGSTLLEKETALLVFAASIPAVFMVQRGRNKQRQ